MTVILELLSGLIFLLVGVLCIPGIILGFIFECFRQGVYTGRVFVNDYWTTLLKDKDKSE